MPSKFVLGGLVLVLACSACDERVCTDEVARTEGLPERLSGTGLFADMADESLETGVYPYSPEFALWSDGADKRRFIAVPEGERIDTDDSEAWRFPVGTKLWKEFSRGGVHLETRLLQKVGAGDDDWAAAAYLWRADQSDAVLVPYGAVDALGTSHNVPASGECFACHEGRQSRILGFSAIQLAPRSYEAPERLREEASTALLSEPIPELNIPGEPAERAALGYLHANCSHCHNQGDSARAGRKCFNPNQRLSFDLDFSLHTQELSSVSATATYRTALGEVIKRGNPGDSKVIERMERRRGGFAQMPPLGTEQVDDHGVDVVSDWIRSL